MNYKIILGSQSPRRKELLSSIGLAFEIRTKDTDESFPSDLEISLIPEYIARNKAKALLADLKEDEVLICADTIVVLGNEIFGKPENREEAISMLQRLSGNLHKVITGVCIYFKEKDYTFHEVTDVYFKDLSLENIKTYVEQFSPLDKAGAYGIQEWIGHIGIEKINGSYENVVGLPTSRLYEELAKLKII